MQLVNALKRDFGILAQINEAILAFAYALNSFVDVFNNDHSTNSTYDEETRVNLFFLVGSSPLLHSALATC